MNELIKITESNGKKAVSARELYHFLEIETPFSKWIKRMLEYGFNENLDWTKLSCDNQLIEYVLSLDCAKEISMIQRSEKGKLARQYFIECEKQLQSVAKPLSTIDILKLTIQSLEEQQKGLEEVRRDVLELKAKTATRPDYFTIVGYGSINGMSLNLNTAMRYGKMAASICNKRNIAMDEMPDPRFGRVRLYPTEVLKEVFETKL